MRANCDVDMARLVIAPLVVLHSGDWGANGAWSLQNGKASSFLQPMTSVLLTITTNTFSVQAQLLQAGSNDTSITMEISF
jgi:hypothetical protein